MPAPLWSFADSITVDRSKALLSIDSFDTILEQLCSARVEAFGWQRYTKAKLQGCHRAEFLLMVEAKTYDAFFNAPVGLRGQYALSEEHGEVATRLVLSKLESMLLAFPRPNGQPTEIEVRKSLAAPQAKIWIDEDEVGLQQWGSSPQLLYPRWQRNSEIGIGLLAPLGDRLIVSGGWLDSMEVVRDNPDKAGRSTDIHTTGYS